MHTPTIMTQALSIAADAHQVLCHIGAAGPMKESEAYKQFADIGLR